MNEEKMTLKESVRLTLRAWRFYWKNTPRFVLSTVLWALADAVSPYAVVWFSARLVAELSDARDPQALAVDAAEIQAINDAIHSGRTHEDALKIGPTGDYE